MTLEEIAQIGAGLTAWDQSHRHAITDEQPGPRTADILAAIAEFTITHRAELGVSEDHLQRILLAWETDGRPT